MAGCFQSKDGDSKSGNRLAARAKQFFLFFFVVILRIMSNDWNGTQMKKEPESKRVKIENKIPEVLEKIQAFELNNSPCLSLSPIVLDLQLLDETDKNVVIKSVILQIPFSGIDLSTFEN